MSMTKISRIGIASCVAALSAVGWCGPAWADDHHHGHGGCLRNDHSSTDLAVHPECPGDRDVRDDDPDGQDAKPLFGQGLLPHGGR
jgi:hypothetical protein